MNSISAILLILQRIEILIPLAAGIIILVSLLILRGKRKSNITSSDLDSIRVISEEEGGEAVAKEEKKISGEELSKLETKILEVLRAKGALKPHPIPASKEGGHYPELAGVSEKDAQTVIDGLIEKGLVLEGEREFSAVACPICGSCSQIAMISCKNCGSLRVNEVKYYRHACGFIGPESSFRSESGLVCPQCGSSENIELYHRKYRCPDCGAEFEEPNLTFKCGSCGALYDEQTMEVKPFKKIESSKEMLGEYERINSAIEAQIETLKREGYRIERPANLVGESGVIHRFEAVARKGDEIIAIASTFGEPMTQTLIRLGVAKSDLKLSKIILVTGRPASPTEKDFARSLGIEFIESV